MQAEIALEELGKGSSKDNVFEKLLQSLFIRFYTLDIDQFGGTAIKNRDVLRTCRGKIYITIFFEEIFRFFFRNVFSNNDFRINFSYLRKGLR